MVQIHEVKKGLSDWKQWYIYLNLIIQISKKKEMLYHAIIDQKKFVVAILIQQIPGKENYQE